jgi:hypothetical protein
MVDVSPVISTRCSGYVARNVRKNVSRRPVWYREEGSDFGSRNCYPLVTWAFVTQTGNREISERQDSVFPA